ncbi:MAG: septum formation inhibitor Maf [Hyphomicrobiales bacterium]|nr:septum formation inhibitor Maf [Hyphomicrobiales bacterium]
MLILASQSATRKSLLHQAGLRFDARPAAIDERAIEAQVASEGADATAVARRLAEAKALAVSATHPGALVIGADQTLALGSDLLHKPEGLAGARAQLDRLRGKSHRLHAGIALARDGQVLWSDVESAEMTMRDYSDAESDAILRLEGEAVLSSVGGYRLEGPSVRLFETISGDYFTILGLPLLPLLAALRRLAPEVFDAEASA